MGETERIITYLKYIKEELIEQLKMNIRIIDGLIVSIKTPAEMKKESNATATNENV